MLKLLPLYLTNKQEVEPKAALGPFLTDKTVYSRAPASGMRVTWFGLSSMLVELDDLRLLIDPVWEERASPFSFAGPKRFFAPTLALGELPSLDAVLLSHDHFDHLGKTTESVVDATASSLGMSAGRGEEVLARPRGRRESNHRIQLDGKIRGQRGRRSVVERDCSSGAPLLGQLSQPIGNVFGFIAIVGREHRIYGSDSDCGIAFRRLRLSPGPLISPCWILGRLTRSGQTSTSVRTARRRR